MQNTAIGNIDGNAADITPLALVPKAGATGLAADAGHVHPNTLVWAGPACTVKSGAYILSDVSIGTSGSLGNGTLRLCPFLLTSTVTFTQIGSEFTAAGDAASLFLMLIYADDGTGYPGSLWLNGGSISTGAGNAGTVATGGTPGVYMNTGLTATVFPPGIYWAGGVVQGVTVTQPTMRVAFWTTAFKLAVNVTPGAGGSSFGYSATGVTGTPPAAFTAFGSSGGSSSVGRIILKQQ